jgi:ADP-heptose:LPS heptosyltransferase
MASAARRRSLRPKGASRIANILIVRFDGIGDAAILAPLVAGLRADGHRLDIVLSERNHEVFAPGVFAGAFSVPWGAWKTRYVRRDFASLLGTLRAREYDWVLVPTEELAAYRLAHATGAPHRRGFENGLEKPFKTVLVRLLCTNTLYRPASLREPMHEAHVQYRLAEGLGAPPQPPQDPGTLRPLFVDEVQRDGDTIALQMTGKWQALGLSTTTLAQLAAQLARRGPLRILVSRNEAALAEALGSEHAVDIFDELMPWKRAIASAAVLVTPDTGAAHIAGMIGTPTVDCFPALDFMLQTARWAPWAARAELVALGPGSPGALDQILGAVESLRRYNSIPPSRSSST